MSEADAKPPGTRRNMLWSGAAYMAGPASQILAAPYLIRHLGKEAYGVMFLVNSGDPACRA
jgi:O-antigen/teichoic acid export membrane protein